MPQSHGAQRQRAHYNEILDEYDAHYGDPTSLEYRRRFFMSPLLEGLDLNDLDVADLAAGSGHTTLELRTRFSRTRPVGFDISEQACKAYTARTGCEALVLDLTGGVVPDRSFDVAVIVGGLHHCVTSLGQALGNIARMVRPGGLLLMVEPSRDALIEPVRRLWYRQDRYFEASTEGALSHDELAPQGAAWFEPLWVRYMGGAAYFLIYNSLVFRMPAGLKPYVASPLMRLETITNQLRWKRLFPYFLARWRRR